MKSARVELRLTEELLGRVDRARGLVSRNRWVENAIEIALGMRQALDEAKPKPIPPPAPAPPPPPVSRVPRATIRDFREEERQRRREAWGSK